jgi:transcriptional regulator with XRE-family HTH domain
MVDPDEISSPIAWQRWLSGELVRLRTAARLTQRDTARALRCSVGKVSYLESGDRPVDARELSDILLPLYGVPEDERRGYVHAADTAAGDAWWDAWTDEDLPGPFRKLIGLEDAAITIRAFELSAIHGLLQTPEYAHAIIRATYNQPAEERAARLVELRMARQKALTRDRPLDLQVVLDEAALHRRVGDAEVQRDQLLHLVRTVDALPNVALRVVTFLAGPYPMLNGPFSLLTFAWPNDPGVVFVEEFDGPRFVETRSFIYRHSAAFDQLVRLALAPDESLSFIENIAQRGARD